MSKNTVFIIDGLPDSGKRTFVKFLRQKLVQVIDISYHDALELVAKKMGWRNIPNDKENYAFLDKLHEVWTGFNNNLIEQVLEQVHSDYSPHTVIIILPKTNADIEELILRLKDNYDVMTVLVYNKRANIDVSLADKIGNYDYDILVNNNKTLEDLKKESNMFIARYVKSFIRLSGSPIRKAGQSKKLTNKKKK